LLTERGRRRRVWDDVLVRGAVLVRVVTFG
jgi:hypothetical protein